MQTTCSHLLRLAGAAGALSVLALSGCLSRNDGYSGYSAPSPSAPQPQSQSLPVIGEPLPAQPQTVAPDPNKVLVEHTIVAGDSLWKLGRDYKTSVAEIKAANQMTDDTIIAGKTILIPTAEPPAGSTPVTQPDTMAPGTPMPPSAAPSSVPSTPAPQPQFSTPQPQPTLITPEPAPVEPIPTAPGQ